MNLSLRKSETWQPRGAFPVAETKRGGQVQVSEDKGFFPNTLCWIWAQFGPRVDAAPSVGLPAGGQPGYVVRMTR